jgi:hypothetical protein
MGAPSAIVRRMLLDGEIECVDLQPGDFVGGRKVYSVSNSQPDPVSARETVLARYPRSPQRAAPSAEAFAELLRKMRTALAARAADADAMDVAIVLRDYPAAAIHVQLEKSNVSVEPIAPERIEQHDPEAIIETRTDLVSSTMRSPFGRDLITIGYGANVRLRSRDVMARAPHDRLLTLLSPPESRWRERLRKDPLRTLAFVLGDPSMRLDIFSRVLRKRRPAPVASPEPELYAVTSWA